MIRLMRMAIGLPIFLLGLKVCGRDKVVAILAHLARDDEFVDLCRSAAK